MYIRVIAHARTHARTHVCICACTLSHATNFKLQNDTNQKFPTLFVSELWLFRLSGNFAKKWKNAISGKSKLKDLTFSLSYTQIFIVYDTVHYQRFPTIPRISQQHYQKLRFRSYKIEKKRKNAKSGKSKCKNLTFILSYAQFFIAYDTVHYQRFPTIPRISQQHYQKLRFRSYKIDKKGGISIYLCIYQSYTYLRSPKP